MLYFLFRSQGVFFVSETLFFLICSLTVFSWTADYSTTISDPTWTAWTDAACGYSKLEKPRIYFPCENSLIEFSLLIGTGQRAILHVCNMLQFCNWQRYQKFSWVLVQMYESYI